MAIPAALTAALPNGWATLIVPRGRGASGFNRASKGLIRAHERLIKDLKKPIKDLAKAA